MHCFFFFSDRVEPSGDFELESVCVWFTLLVFCAIVTRPLVAHRLRRCLREFSQSNKPLIGSPVPHGIIMC